MTDVLITAGELADLTAKEPCVIIDTRNPDAYAAGHLPNAVNVHEIFTYLATSTPEGMQELKTKFADAFGKAGLSGKETAVIYEQSMNSGFGQSCRGYYLLTMLGYPKVKVLHAFRRRGGEICEDLVHVDGIREMPGGIGIGISRVDDHAGFFRLEFGEFAGRNQNVRHVRPLLFVVEGWGRSGVRLELTCLPASFAAAWWPASRWR